jgi:hypothetical protein
LTEKEIHDPIESRYNPASGHKEDYFVCMPCNQGAAGYCRNSVLHPILRAMKLTLLDSK